jgi:hypothetical protein
MKSRTSIWFAVVISGAVLTILVHTPLMLAQFVTGVALSGTALALHWYANR